MRLPELLVLYLLIGVACAAARIARAGAGRRQSLVDAAWLLPLWPLHLPMLLAARAEPPPDQPTPGDPFLDALAGAAGTPLAELLPDAQTAQALAARLRTADARIHEIDRLLDEPAFSLAAADAREAELEARGDERGTAVARSRADNIRRLQALRDRCTAELEEVGDLVAQLRVQAEVVRLSGDIEGQAARDLVFELVCRVEGLDAILGDVSAPAGPPR